MNHAKYFDNDIIISVYFTFVNKLNEKYRILVVGLIKNSSHRSKLFRKTILKFNFEYFPLIFLFLFLEFYNICNKFFTKFKIK